MQQANDSNSGFSTVGAIARHDAMYKSLLKMCHGTLYHGTWYRTMVPGTMIHGGTGYHDTWYHVSWYPVPWYHVWCTCTMREPLYRYPAHAANNINTARNTKAAPYNSG
jgi:hypothetical protein